jgi:hypothetical protein
MIDEYQNILAATGRLREWPQDIDRHCVIWSFDDYSLEKALTL